MSLIGYDWPGNVRELFNILEMAIGLACGTITQSMLPANLKPERSVETDEPAPVLRNLSDNVEKAAILQALDDYAGNKSKVCELEFHAAVCTANSKNIKLTCRFAE